MVLCHAKVRGHILLRLELTKLLLVVKINALE